MYFSAIFFTTNWLIFVKTKTFWHKELFELCKWSENKWMNLCFCLLSLKLVINFRVRFWVIYQQGCVHNSTRKFGSQANIKIHSVHSTLYVNTGLIDVQKLSLKIFQEGSSLNRNKDVLLIKTHPKATLFYYANVQCFVLLANVQIGLSVFH